MFNEIKENKKAYKTLEKKAIDEKYNNFENSILYYVAKEDGITKVECHNKKKLEFIADLDYMYYRQIWTWNKEKKCHTFYKEWKEGELSNVKDIL